MILTRLMRLGAFGLTLAALGVAGSASAQSAISTTGPFSTNIINEQTGTVTTLSNRNNVSTGNFNNQFATTGSASVSGNTGFGIGSGWSSWDPMQWQMQGRSFSDWWNGMMGEMGTVHASAWGDGSMSSWTPTGSNWQGTWSNWDPNMWRANGATFGDWFGCMMSHLTNNHRIWMNNWSMGEGGGFAMSGNAFNSNNTGTNVGITNNNPEFASSDNSGNGSGTIFLTGPHSTNIIDSSTSQTTRVSNDNNVNTQNFNNQQAESGSATVSGNTIGGNATSGNAVNENQTETNVNLSNNTSVPQPVMPSNNGPAFIGTTGPHSTNVVATTDTSRFTETNVNNVMTTNSNSQFAQSGNARVSGNTFGGNATSGEAFNSNSTNNETNIAN